MRKENTSQMENVKTVIIREISETSLDQLAKDITEIKKDMKTALLEISKLKNMLSQLLNQQQILKANEQNSTNGTPVPLVKASFPIGNMSDMTVIENQLGEDENFFQAMVDEFTGFCGETGQKSARSCCYAIIDHFFAREFLVSFTWTGVTNSDDQKFALKSFQNIIKLFFTIINKADPKCDMEEIRSFFQNVLKNAVRRLLSSRNYSSVSRIQNTSKSKKPKIVEDNATICIKDDEDEDGSSNS